MSRPGYLPPKSKPAPVWSISGNGDGTVLALSQGELHVIPVIGEHQIDSHCPCGPRFEFLDSSVTLGWVH